MSISDSGRAAKLAAHFKIHIPARKKAGYGHEHENGSAVDEQDPRGVCGENGCDLVGSERNRSEIERTFILLGMAEAMGLLVYHAKGGENPEIFIRINSFLQLERAVRDPQNYENRVLSNVKERHVTSVEMLKYLFQKEVSTGKFWDLIEDYFLGKLPGPVRADLNASLKQG